jgi:hypothetical protein
MTRPDHTAVPPAGVIAAAELKPCPFCGGAARIQSNRDWHRLYADHDEGCVFDADDHMLMYPAQAGYLVQIAEDWNRRAEGAAPTAAQAAPVSEPVAYPGIEHLTTYSGQDITQNYCLQHEGRFFDVEDVQRAFAAQRAAWDAEAKLGEACKAMAWKAASHAPNAALAASRDAESATSGATSAAKVELEAAALKLLSRICRNPENILADTLLRDDVRAFAAAQGWPDARV